MNTVSYLQAQARIKAGRARRFKQAKRFYRNLPVTMCDELGELASARLRGLVEANREKRVKSQLARFEKNMKATFQNHE